MAHLLAIAGRSGPRSGNVDAGIASRELARFEVYSASGERQSAPASQMTINASGNSTVFNGQVMNFGAFHFHMPSPPGKENGTS